MAGTKARKYGSTEKTRTQVLMALGVVKVATAAQIRLLMCPGTADAATARGGCKDLEAEGLVLSAGRTSRLEADGRRITEKLWSLTPSGLEAAAVVLDRPVREMGGTAKAAAASGAKHAGKVTDTLAALLQTPPETTAPVVRKNTVPAQAPAPEQRPAGMGPIAAWSTEVSLPVVGSFAAPQKGSLRADMTFAATGTELPLLFVEVDNGTESPPILAEKIARYQKFFARTVTQGKRDVVLWRTVWSVPDPGRHGGGSHPPVAVVFTKKMGAQAMADRMQNVADLSQQAWRGRWTSGHGGLYRAQDPDQDGYFDYEGTVPVVMTVLDRLERHGPHGPIWWRCGRKPALQTLADALDNPNDVRAYEVREEARRKARDAEYARAAKEREEELRRREASAWPCPSCGRQVYPAGTDGGWGEGSTTTGGLCRVCQSAAADAARREAAEDQGDDGKRRRGWFGRGPGSAG